jgi:hypothetical protein
MDTHQEILEDMAVLSSILDTGYWMLDRVMNTDFRDGWNEILTYFFGSNESRVEP